MLTRLSQVKLMKIFSFSIIFRASINKSRAISVPFQSNSFTFISYKKGRKSLLDVKWGSMKGKNDIITRVKKRAHVLGTNLVILLRLDLKQKSSIKNEKLKKICS
jgi:hypothetical protein